MSDNQLGAIPAPIIRPDSAELTELVLTTLVWLQFVDWFDERVIDRIVSSNRFRSWFEPRLTEPQAGLRILVLSELLSRDYCEPTIPVGYRITEHGRSSGANRAAQLSPGGLDAIASEVATTYVGLTRRGGGRRARRSLVESARQAKREASDDLIARVLSYVQIFAERGHADLVPVVLSSLFEGESEPLQPGTPALVRVGLDVAEHRAWTRTKAQLQSLQASLERSPTPRTDESVYKGASGRGRPVVTARELLDARVHLGGRPSQWNPKMRPYILSKRSGLYIIDLRQTLQCIATAYVFVRELVAGGGFILFVGTKRPARDSIADQAIKCGMPYVNERWLGGMLTNFQTVTSGVEKMEEYQRLRDSGSFEAMPKKEALLRKRHLEKLERNLMGIHAMDHLPDAIFLVDPEREHLGVAEANRLRIPIVGIVDTDCDPGPIQYPIPGNDDGIVAVGLFCRVIADAVTEGQQVASYRLAAATRSRQIEQVAGQSVEKLQGTEIWERIRQVTDEDRRRQSRGRSRRKPAAPSGDDPAANPHSET